MRKSVVALLCLCILILTGLKSSTEEYVNETWMTQHFGYKFIPAHEIGLKELPILFTEQGLRSDNMSWSMPLKRNGVLAYHLIRASCSQNTYEKNDTLSLSEAEMVIKTIIKTGRNFPDNNEKIHFFKTKNIICVDGIEYAKTIVYDCRGYYVIDLPINVSVILVGKNSNKFSYISDSIGGITISLASDALKNKEEVFGSTVMTLVNLTPSQ